MFTGREESWKRFDAEREERQRLGMTGQLSGEPDCDSLWTSSFSAGATKLPLGARVFSIGFRLAELITALRGNLDREETPRSVQQFIDQLNRNFGNLRELLKSEQSVVETLFDPVIDSFVETLIEVGAVRPEIRLKCEALAHEVKTLLIEPPQASHGESSDPDIPF